jgi:hypothetical protein
LDVHGLLLLSLHLVSMMNNILSSIGRKSLQKLPC